MTYELLSKKAKQIYDRYQKCYVTDEQLLRYLELHAITQDEYDFIYITRHAYSDVPDVTE